MMKRFLRLILGLMLVAGLMIFACSAGAEALNCGVTYRTDRINLRQQPTQHSTRLGVYDEGVWMVITGESGNWYQVTAPDGKSGYMSKNYVAVQEITYATMGVVSNPKATAFLNLRQSPSYTAKVLGIYYNGVPCVLRSQSGGWYSVRVDGVEGYFRQEYIQQKHLPYADKVATIVTPNGTGLNLRTGPGKGYPSMGQYQGGSYVMVLQKGADWWKVSADGQVGYMSTEYLRDGVLTPSAALLEGSGGTVEAGYAVVSNPKSTQVLNLRADISTGSRIIGQFGNGVRVTVLDQGTEWCRVRTAQNQVGFMMTRYLKLHNLPEVPIRTVNHPQRSYVNLRQAPSILEGKVLAKMPHGARVKIIAPDDGWTKVSYNGQTGYVLTAFLQ